jgi:hypothetical protein
MGTPKRRGKAAANATSDATATAKSAAAASKDTAPKKEVEEMENVSFLYSMWKK